MKIMCDTNIVIDTLLDRAPFSDDSYEIIKMCENNLLSGFISASSITDIYYLVRKHTHSREQAYAAIGSVLDVFNICSVSKKEVLEAYQIKAKDFEDCLLACCARSLGCCCIITRNKKDFEQLGIPVFTPREFLTHQWPILNQQ